MRCNYRLFRILFFFLLLVIVHTVLGQQLKPAPQVMTILSDVDDREPPDGLYLPKPYNRSKNYPLVTLEGQGRQELAPKALNFPAPLLTRSR